MKKCPLYRIARPIISLYMKMVYNIKIINKSYIPEHGKCILAGNHTNNLDSLLIISSTKRTIRFLAKKEIHKGIFKHLFLSAGTIPVDRKIKDENVKNKTIEALKNEELICIFPEGTINRTNNTIIPFKYGTVSFASKTDTPIVPFIIKGKYKLFRKKIYIKFLKPYYIKNKNLEIENQKLMNIIKKELEETSA
jgi:1-acyl-sn-glycerol-3-phosphate acyltransferase